MHASAKMLAAVLDDDRTLTLWRQDAADLRQNQSIRVCLYVFHPRYFLNGSVVRGAYPQDICKSTPA